MTCDSDLWPHEVVILPRDSMNVYGENVGTGERRVKAYIEPKLSIEHGAMTREASFGTTVVVDDILVRPEDRMVMPGGQERVIQSVARYDYWDGLKHSVVTVA